MVEQTSTIQASVAFNQNRNGNNTASVIMSSSVVISLAPDAPSGTTQAIHDLHLPLDECVEPRRGIAVRERLVFDGGRETELQAGLREGVEQVFLGVDVVVETSGQQADALCDVLQPRRPVAALVEFLRRRAEDCLPTSLVEGAASGAQVVRISAGTFSWHEPPICGVNVVGSTSSA